MNKGVRHRHGSEKLGGLANRDDGLEDRLIHELSRKRGRSGHSAAPAKKVHLPEESMRATQRKLVAWQ